MQQQNLSNHRNLTAYPLSIFVYFCLFLSILYLFVAIFLLNSSNVLPRLNSGRGSLEYGFWI